MKTIQKFANALALGRLATAPSNSIDGTIYYDTTLNEFSQFGIQDHEILYPER